jgi:hypothetical protein
MAQPIARDAEDFARLLLQTVERLGAGGEWVAARDAFERAAADHPDHPYLGHLAAKPGRRIGLSAVTERLRAAEYAHIERRKAGTKRNTPVLYRTGQPTVELGVQLPQEAPSSHPLVTKRRAVEEQIERESSARRIALTEPAAKSPWRRRLLPRPGAASTGVTQATRALRRWWRQLHGLVASVSGGPARR